MQLNDGFPVELEVGIATKMAVAVDADALCLPLGKLPVPPEALRGRERELGSAAQWVAQATRLSRSATCRAKPE
jgi:hypothetical protein